MTQLLAQQITDSFIQLVFTGRNPVLIERPYGEDDDPAVQEFETVRALALDCLESNDWNRVIDFLEPSLDVSTWVGDTPLTFEHGVIAYQGFELNNGLTARIVQLRKDEALNGSKNEQEMKKLFKLLNKLMDNSSKRVVDSMWDYLSRNNVPVMDNGNIILYSTLEEDGTMNGVEHNKKGVIQRPRNMVDDVATDPVMSLCAPIFNAVKDVGVYKVNPKNVVYVSNRTVSVCKMKQIDVIKGKG